MGFTDRFTGKSKKQDNKPQENEENQNVEQNEEFGYAEQNGLAEEIVKIKSELEELRAKHDLALRALAEKENQLRSSLEMAKKDAQIAKDDYAKKLINGIASEFDNMFKAIGELSKKFGEDGNILALTKIAEKIENAFKNVGVEFIKPQVGEQCNAEMHNVITTIPNPTMENGQILDVISSCWKVGDKVVRCAEVIAVKND